MNGVSAGTSPAAPPVTVFLMVTSAGTSLIVLISFTWLAAGTSLPSAATTVIGFFEKTPGAHAVPGMSACGACSRSVTTAPTGRSATTDV